MSARFRPQMEALEAREVPASVTVHFANGMNGFGEFSTPAGVDPTQASQTLPVTDLSMAVSLPGSTTGGLALAVQPGATATYQYGVLVGGNATATGAGTVTLNLGTVTAGVYSAPAAYDAADTQQTFTLPDGTVGAISYTIPWDQVDPTQATQALAPTTFNVNIAGQNFTSGSASYTQAPTAMFANGVFQGVSFALTPPAGFGYTSFTGSLNAAGNNIITAIQGGTNQQFQVAAPVKNSALMVDFNTYNSTSTAQTLTVEWKLSDGTDEIVKIPIAAGTSAGAVRDTVFSVLQDNGLNVTPTGDTRLLVKGTATGQLSALYFSVINPPNGWVGPSFASRVANAAVTPQLFIQGKEYNTP